MDSPSDMPEGAGKYIWLRYTTQFTAGERTHTIEMGIPMPLGASAETRELLLCEAEAGMEQLAYHVEQRVDQMLSSMRAKRSASIATPQPPSPPKPANNKPAATANSRSSQEQSTSTRIRETTPEQPAPYREEIPTRPLTRPDSETNTLPAAGLISDTNNRNLPLRDFIQYIKENLGLDPKQAMNLLKVKTLSGINLREALDRLLQLIGQEATDTTSNTERTREVSPDAMMIPSSQTMPLNALATPPPSLSSTQPIASIRTQVNEFEQEHTTDHLDRMSIVAFDEELGPEDEEELEDLTQIRDLTPQERARARSLLNRLQEARGTTTASSSRLQALKNVIDTQISDSQLQELVAGVWGVTSLKKLKIDQVEALITWAKVEDDFVNDVEAILLLLEEERYARGNR